MTNYAVFGQFMAGYNILEQPHQQIDLLLGPLWPILLPIHQQITRVNKLNTNTGGIKPGTAMPAAVASMPCAPVFRYQLIDFCRLIAYQVMTADAGLRQQIYRLVKVN